MRIITRRRVGLVAQALFVAGLVSLIPGLSFGWAFVGAIAMPILGKMLDRSE